MSIDKDFAPHQESLELKELGFNEPCFGYHLCKNSALGVYLEITTEWIDLLSYDSSSCKAPTFSQAFRWFREKHNLPSHIHTIWQHDWNNYSYQWHITEDKKEWNCIEHFEIYEEAELACLRKLIEIVKQKS